MALDLLDPERTVVLTLTDDAAARPEAFDVVAATRRAAESDETPPTLPTAWRRMCVVGGVDRWFDGDLDEDLLAADLATAAVEAGDDDGARLFDLAHDALAALTGRSELPTAVARELRRVLQAAVRGRPDDPRFRTLEAGLVSVRTPPLALPDLPDWVSTGSVLISAHASMTALDGGATGRLDPARVAPRLVLGPPLLEVGPDDVVEVWCPAFPGVTRTTPGAGGLLARAAVTATGEVAALGSLQFDAEHQEFIGRVRLVDVAPSDVDVEVLDPRFAGRPRCRPEDEATVRLLVAAQSAFREARQAHARHAVSGEPDRDGLATAAMAFGEAYVADPRAWAAFDSTLTAEPGDPSADPVLRPLLAELVATT